MAKVYITRCIVKRDGNVYQKGSIIEDLSSDDIKKGLSQKWLEAVGNDKEPTEEKSIKPKGNPKTSTKSAPKKPEEVKPTEEKPEEVKPTEEELEEQTEETLEKTREELFVEAAALGLSSQITEATTAEEIQKLIEEAQAQ